MGQCQGKRKASTGAGSCKPRTTKLPANHQAGGGREEVFGRFQRKHSPADTLLSDFSCHNCHAISVIHAVHLWYLVIVSPERNSQCQETLDKGGHVRTPIKRTLECHRASVPTSCRQVPAPVSGGSRIRANKMMNLGLTGKMDIM